MMNILYVTPYVPSLIRTRPYHLIRTLIQFGHRVTLLTVAENGSFGSEALERLRKWGVQVEVFRVPLRCSLINAGRALLSAEPFQASVSYSHQMERRLAELTTNGKFDIAHIEHLRAARLVRAIHGTPRAYDAVDCISLLFEQASQYGPTWWSRWIAHVDLERTQAYEAWLLTQYHHVLVSSQRDKEALERLGRERLPSSTPIAPIAVVTNGVDTDFFRPSDMYPERDRHTIVFTGKMSYHANIGGALYFVREVLPRVWAHEPSMRLQIVGKDPPKVIQQLARDHRIEVTGTVSDLRPYLARAAVAVCPVRYAAGVQNKMLEAMAMGTPVVCTRAAADGLWARDGQELLIAGDAEAFAQQILRVCTDPKLAQRLSEAGRHYVETHHHWRRAAESLQAVYAEAICSEKKLDPI